MSPTPWKTTTTDYEPNMGRNEPVMILDRDGRYVATCGRPGAPKPADVENAEAIVTAVNIMAAANGAVGR